MSYTFLNPALVLVIGLAFGQELPPVAIFPGLLLIVAATFVLQSQLTQGALAGRHRGLFLADAWSVRRCAEINNLTTGDHHDY